MKVIGLITPDRYFAPWEFVKSILALPKEYLIVVKQGARLDENRNAILHDVRNQDALLMIDTDMVFTKEDVEKILRHIDEGKDYVSGVFRAGHQPHPVCVYSGYDEVAKKHIPAMVEGRTEPFKIHASGLAFVAISGRLMRELPPFAFNRDYKKNVLLGGDLAFGKLVRELGFELWCDPTIKIGHVISSVV